MLLYIKSGLSVQFRGEKNEQFPIHFPRVIWNYLYFVVFVCCVFGRWIFSWSLYGIKHIFSLQHCCVCMHMYLCQIPMKIKTRWWWRRRVQWRKKFMTNSKVKIKMSVQFNVDIFGCWCPSMLRLNNILNQIHLFSVSRAVKKC